jgi:hypothetical protein
MPETLWAQGGPWSETRDLCDPSVGEGPGRWKRLPLTETKIHEGMIYV